MLESHVVCSAQAMFEDVLGPAWGTGEDVDIQSVINDGMLPVVLCV
jgi:hypothetical protein